MTTITIDIPDNKAKDLSAYATKIGGRVVDKKSAKTARPANTEEDEVTHESYFGENLKRVINAFKK
ncbi:hypothetical protein SNE25_12305 [Mucilaginibacter sabulilitoris]|uniref:Uncharacterized protein n=1 Tax=Mucilaginibacter sabulilitoris TaxID=1173583 RepID=A0ABZ0TT74_9SPHI|nr:hypothetical protein [Mucilaginibacter sabulilitoris]WPU96300.1 hypothetical protein SNE25_12305 [Mucilaginibacter sabulilitoris]